MGSTDVALLGVLTFMALGLSWFAVRVNMMLWRLGAALVWLAIGIVIWTNTLGSDIADPWTYALALALLVMIIAVLTLQMSSDIKHEASVRNVQGFPGSKTESWTGWGPKPRRKKQSELTAMERQADYKKRLKGGR